MPIINSEDFKTDRSCYTNSEDLRKIKGVTTSHQQKERSSYDIDGGIFENGNDDYEEKMSSLGAIINAKDEIDWETIDLNSVTFFCISTHECRRMGTNDLLMPEARINDGKMYIWGAHHGSKLEWLWMIKEISAGRGRHVKMPKFFQHEIKQMRLEPSKILFC